jgi:hypothetical protein
MSELEQFGFAEGESGGEMRTLFQSGATASHPFRGW